MARLNYRFSANTIRNTKSEDTYVNETTYLKTPYDTSMCGEVAVIVLFAGTYPGAVRDGIGGALRRPHKMRECSVLPHGRDALHFKRVPTR